MKTKLVKISKAIIPKREQEDPWIDVLVMISMALWLVFWILRG